MIQRRQHFAMYSRERFCCDFNFETASALTLAEGTKVLEDAFWWIRLIFSKSKHMTYTFFPKVEIKIDFLTIIPQDQETKILPIDLWALTSMASQHEKDSRISLSFLHFWLPLRSESKLFHPRLWGVVPFCRHISISLLGRKKLFLHRPGFLHLGTEMLRRQCLLNRFRHLMILMGRPFFACSYEEISYITKINHNARFKVSIQRHGHSNFFRVKNLRCLCWTGW